MRLGDVLDFSGTEVSRIDLDDDLARLGVDTLLLDARSSPPEQEISKIVAGSSERNLLDFYTQQAE